MERFGGVKEKRRRSRAGESGGDFPADQAGLAEARDDDAAPAGEKKFDCFIEARIDARDEIGNGFRLDAQYALRRFDIQRSRLRGFCWSGHCASHSRASEARCCTFSTSP